jgi:membrane-bound metal-dependent hydrolase YbcI (DUF457 family)
MFAVGHMAIGYLLGKTSATRLKININIPTILTLSIIPDIDLLIAGGLFHRGPTHSAVLALIVFIPFFAVYRKKALPYFLALLSHGAIGDLIVVGKIQLFWPISQNYISLPPPLPRIPMTSPTNVALELTLFAVATIVMYKAKDFHVFFQNRKSNLLLVIPIATVLLPTFIAYPIIVPTALIPPHVFYLFLFSASVLIVIFRLFRQHPKTQR